MSAEQDLFLSAAEEAIQLLDDIETDVSSKNSIVRYLMSRARKSAVQALVDMAVADPDDVPNMKRLQSEFNHYGDLRLWLAEAMSHGQQAEGLAKDMMSESQAREAMQAGYVGGEEPRYED